MHNTSYIIILITLISLYYINTFLNTLISYIKKKIIIIENYMN